jgi:hypothetical protein
MSRLRKILFVAAISLSACSGSGDRSKIDISQPTIRPQFSVPDNALGSSGAYTQYLLNIVSATSEQDEPLLMDNVGTPPSSESDEPIQIG